MTDFKKIDFREIRRSVTSRFPQLLEDYDPDLNDGKRIPHIEDKHSLYKYIAKCHVCGRTYPTTIHSEVRKLENPKHVEGRCDNCRGNLKSVNNINYGYIEFRNVKSLVKVEDVNNREFVDFECSLHGIFQCKVEYANKLMKQGKSICRECRKMESIKITALDYRPELELDWDPTNTTRLDQVSYGSREVLKWICHYCGHHWPREVKARTLLKRDCPKCNHNIQHFADVYPQFKKNFNPKNDFPYEQELQWSEKQALWVCDVCGYERNLSFDSLHAQLIYDSTKFPCPVCAGNIKMVGFNSIFDVHPELRDQWDYEANAKEGIYPETVGVIYNDHPVHLFCLNFKHPYTLRLDRKYEYDEAGKESCPYCDDRETLPGFNDLPTTDPILSMEYSPNNDRSVTAVRKSLKEASLWVCPKCHGEYLWPTNEREVGDDVCPYCNDLRTLAGFNDLPTTDPVLSLEYSPKNERPVTAVRKSLKEAALWICPRCNGEYLYSINDRQLNDNICPYCNNKRPLKGFNDLTVTNKELVDEEWDYIANIAAGFKQPYEYLNTSTERVWWKCKVCRTEYLKQIDDKVINERRGITSCYFCANRQINKVLLVKK